MPVTVLAPGGGSAISGGELVPIGDQTTVDATGGGVVLAPANPDRLALIIQNTGANPMRVASSGLTATNGIRCAAGQTLVFSDPVITAGMRAIREGGSNTTAVAAEVI